MMMAVANSTRPSYAEELDAGFPAIPFFSWEALHLSLWKQRTREINTQPVILAVRDIRSAWIYRGLISG